MLEALTGKYAAFIIGSYGLSLIVLAGLAVWAMRAHARAKRLYNQSREGT